MPEQQIECRSADDSRFILAGDCRRLGDEGG